jgi:SAM-dependent methyltransferase
MTTAYGYDLARVHHESFGDLAGAAASTVLSSLRRGGVGKGLVVDLGCGTGILARRLSDAGYDVLGVDYSADMLRIARSHAPRAKFLHSSIFDADLPPCVAVTAIGEVVNYAFDERAGVDRLGDLLHRVHTSLRPGGVVLFDVAGPGRHGPKKASEQFHDTEGWTMHVSTQEDPAGAVLTRDITLFFRTGTSYRRSDESHVLRLYKPPVVTGLLRETGFSARRLPGYGDLRFRGLACFLGRKRLG